MAMEVAARFIALRDNGEDEAVVAMMTENATLGTVWGCISGKKNISNYLKDEKRFRYLEKKFGPLKQLDDNTCYRMASIRRQMAEYRRWYKLPTYRETYFIKDNNVRLVIFERLPFLK
eukprot:PhF_6_TR24943/c0_g1_i3/m.34327